MINFILDIFIIKSKKILQIDFNCYREKEYNTKLVLHAMDY